MLDIGWPELLVVAIILIVVVGPKDLPQMLRTFGKMTTRLRKTAGEFRAQFDEALRESELDDVRQTISDARKLNPMNSVRDALNPLKQAGNEIKSGLQNAVKADPVKGPVEPQEDDFKIGEPATKLPSDPPDLKPEAAASSKASAKADAGKPAAKKPAAKKTAAQKTATPKTVAKKPATKASDAKAASASKSAADKAKAAPAAKATSKIASKPTAAKPAKSGAASKSTAAAKKPATAKKTTTRKTSAAKKTGDA